MATKEPIETAGMRIQFLLEGSDTDDALSVFRCDFQAGARVPIPHSHDAFEETVFGLSGTVTFTVDGVPHELGAGDVLHVPRGVVHGFAVSEPASILAIATPGVFSSTYMEEMAEVINAAGDGPPDRDALVAIMLRHGLTPRPPAAPVAAA